MNILGIPLSFSPGARKTRTGVLVFFATGSLALTACGGSNSTAPDQAASESTSASASASQTAHESASASATATDSTGEAPAENFSGSEALAKANEVDANSEEVKTTEQLYTDIQGALANIEPVTTPTTGNTGEDVVSDTENMQAQEQVASEQYVSAETTAKLEEAAIDSALDQYLATATEYALSGWHVEGSSTVVGSPRVAEGEYKGQAAKIMEVCLDSSQVKVVDAAGNTMSSNQTPRSLNIFTLIEDNGTWKIASHDFPNNADC
ncbi:hypothetical protein [Rothia nasimurium]|uniref:hypothetical protein n=1 Tax=Rothia nasimurium TaxID=85336 RepID=UPI0009F28E6C|nr:hypothetical protein [Rothia nasimurium]